MKRLGKMMVTFDVYRWTQTASAYFERMSTKALTVPFVVSAYENRDVDTCDIVGVYANTVIDAFTTIKLEGNMVKLMVQVDLKNT